MSKENNNKVTSIDKVFAKTLLKLIPKFITPNQVTISRFILTPIVGWLLYQELYAWGLFLFLLTMLTDALDGAMARTRNQITEIGKIIDPLADKIAIATTAIFVMLKISNPVILWGIVSMEIIIILVSSYRKYILKRDIQAEIFGKLKLIMQVIGIGLLLLYALLSYEWLLRSAENILVIAIVLAVCSLFRKDSI